MKYWFLRQAQAPRRGWSKLMVVLTLASAVVGSAMLMLVMMEKEEHECLFFNRSVLQVRGLSPL